MVSRIYLIRHGVTEGNKNHWYYGSTDLPLTPEGYERIKEYAESGIYPEIPEDADIYTTGLVRTEQTLEAVYGDREHSAIEKLREIDFKSVECKTYDELKQYEGFDAWAWDTTGDARIADAETSNEFHKRIHEGLDELIGKHLENEGRHEGKGDAITVLVCHGGVISCIMEKLFPAVSGSMWDWLPEPGFGYAVDFRDGKPYMYSRINDIGRLGLGIYRVPEGGSSGLRDMIEPYLAGGHGYFEIYYNAGRKVFGEREEHKEDPEKLSEAVREGLVSVHPRESYKLSASIDIGDIKKIKKYIEMTGAGKFDRVSIWDVEKSYMGYKPDTEGIKKTFSELDSLKRKGLIGKVGLGFFGEPAVFDRILKEQGAIDYVELAVNYQSGYGNGERSQKYYTIARRRYKEILVTSPFDGGRLAENTPEGAEIPPKARDRMSINTANQGKTSMAGYAMLKEEQLPKTPVDWALRYVLSLPFVTVCIASTGDKEHAWENLKAAERFIPLTEEQHGTLRSAALSRRTPEYTRLIPLFERAGDPGNARQMSSYMRDMYEFYGIKTPERRKIYKDLLKHEKKRGTVNWAFLDDCYSDPHREFQYLAYDYLLEMAGTLDFDDIDHIRRFIQTKPWWDTVDFLMKVIGKIGEKDPAVDNLMLEWAEDPDIWVRRTAIEHQLGRKERTDTVLLRKILLKNLGSSEFFINKAIGWALRDYSKTDPAWVRNFIEKHRKDMAPLSIREGSKYILRKK